MRKKTIIILLLTMFYFNLIAQQGKISGLIINAETYKPLSNVEIIINNTPFKVKTNYKGKFIIDNINDGSYELVIYKENFKVIKKLITINNNQLKFDLIMEDNIINLPELLIESFSLINGEIGKSKIVGSAHNISKKELLKFNYTNIHEVLSKVPGVNLQEEDGYGLRPNIGLRGTGLERSSKITIMEDGILMAPAPYSSPSAYYFPTIGRMNSIEILKGSSQIKFGPLTTGGAINFISTPIPEKLNGSIKLIGGSNNFRNFHGHVGTSHNNLGFMIEGFNYGSSGYKKLGNNENTGFDKKDYNLKIKYKSDNISNIYHETILSLGETKENSNETYLGLSDEDFIQNPYLRYPGSQIDNMKAEQKRISIKNYLEFNNGLNISTSIYKNNFQRNWYKLQSVVDNNGNKFSISSLFSNDPSEAFNIAKGIIDSKEEGLIVRANNRTYLSKGIQSVINKSFQKNNIKHQISLSSRYHYDEMDRFQWEDKYQILNGIMHLNKKGTPGSNSNRIQYSKALASYINYKIEITELILNLGLRHEHIKGHRDDYGKSDVERLGTNLSSRKNTINSLIPGFGLLYKINRSSSTFIGIHKGFSPPGDKPETNPEKSLNYEIGFRTKSIKLNGEIVGYISDYSNLLGSDLAATGGSGTNELYNAGKAIVKGIEISINYNLSSSDKLQIPIYINYTLTDATFKENFESSFDAWGGEIMKGYKIPYISKHQLNLGINLKSNNISFDVNYSFKSNLRTKPGIEMNNIKELIKSFGIINTALNYNINNIISFHLAIRNLTNNVYSASRRPAGLRPGLPRTFTGGIKFDF
jgi:Fe(3+) dicitrate transport protein